MKNLNINLPPVTDQNGKILTSEELAQIEIEMQTRRDNGQIETTLQRFAKEKVRLEIAIKNKDEKYLFDQTERVMRFVSEMEQMQRSGQMSLQEWRAPICGFDGFTAILCELNPDFAVGEKANLGDFQTAATNAVINAINARQHPQHETLRQIYSDFQTQEKEQRDIDNLFYQWDLALQATAKYRPSAFEKVDFHESRSAYTLRDFIEWLHKLNEKKARETKQKASTPLIAIEYSIHTSQEMDLWHRAQCNGKSFGGYQINAQAGAITFEYKNAMRKSAPHQIRLSLTEDERAAGLAMTYLENLVRNQDADAVFATEYILRLLAPPPHLPARPYAGGWVDFDDVLKKIGWYPQTTIERREMHARIWEYVKFGERAHIIGKRTIPYIDPTTNKEIDTTIHGAAWRVMKTETPDQQSLYSALETPVRAEIVVSAELTALISNSHTVQHFQCGEILGAIPGGQPSGAWARVIGAALSSFWRRNPRECMAGTIKPTRRELLDHFTAKVKPYEEILESPNPLRAINYWCAALRTLANAGFIERTGEAAIIPKEMRDALPTKNWKDIWLDEAVNINPGSKTEAAFNARLEALPALKPRDLKTKLRTKKTRKKL